MSLRKSPTLTPALLASNRQNAKQSTGPRTAQGKAWSRLNRLRNGWRSQEYMDFVMALQFAPPGRMTETAQLLLDSKPAPHRSFVVAAEIGIQADLGIGRELEWIRMHRKSKGGDFFRRSKPEYD
jgi:hypothetical protein